MTQALESYPVTGRPLPVAWDGEAITWGEWSAGTVFICGRGRSGPFASCAQCGRENQVSLAIIGHHSRPFGRLTLLRCPHCGSDSVVDGDGEVWVLDRSDYGPGGSWDARPRPLFDFDEFTRSRCVVCGREGVTGMAVGSSGSCRCEDDDLCARRARARGKDE